ncbi:MAG: Gfo/Idh/MocA family oxidoreductase [Bacteroidia bacterium]
MPATVDRRDFLKTTGVLTAGAMLGAPQILEARTGAKKRIALVGTGVRGVNMWGRNLVRNYSDHLEFVGLCDINPGRLAFAKNYIGATCPTFTDFDSMMKETRPDLLIVTTVDATHHTFIIKGLEMGADVITEKPMTTDEQKCQAILDAEQRTGRRVIVTFNYRYSPHRQVLYELLREGTIGDIVSADFHWYLDVYHGADYFRRWHGYKDKGGTLLVHKATHHFDLLNWWLESEPEEVFAYGSLDHYGKNNSFRHTHCRPCPHQGQCKFYWDITRDQHMVDLYASNEQHDGYLRDGCVWRPDIDIYDKMAVQIRYTSNVHVSYSLTTYSPYEGYRIAFNGTRGRLEAWIKERQPWVPEDDNYDEIRLTENFGYSRVIQVPHGGGGHGGGDTRLLDKLFRNPDLPDPWRQSAGTRDGAMSVLLGIAARKSIEEQRPVKVGSLTSLQPLAKRP